MKAREILKRRRSVTNTKKITRTMEMVATAKFKKAGDRIKAARPYGERLLALVQEVAASVRASGGGLRYPLLEARLPVKRLAVLVLTGNRGLCGGYNNNAIHAARRLVEERRAAGQEVDLHVSGKKGLAYYKFFRWPLASTWTQFEDRPRYDQTEPLAVRMLGEFVEGKIDELFLVYTKFHSSSNQKLALERLLPLAVPEGAGGGGTRVDYLFEPPAEELLADLIPLSFKTAFFTAFLHAAASEQVARMVAMKNATDAAEKMIKSLTRLYNRARQTQITMEISELMGGAEALREK